MGSKVDKSLIARRWSLYEAIQSWPSFDERNVALEGYVGRQFRYVAIEG